MCAVGTAAAAVYLDVPGSDFFLYEGTSCGAGDTIHSSGAAGDFICFYGSNVANQWLVMGRGKNAWVCD
jgi:hypothetical protein